MVNKSTTNVELSHYNQIDVKPFFFSHTIQGRKYYHSYITREWDQLHKTNKNALAHELPIGMATGRVRAGFFHTRTRPAGQDPWPGPAPFRVPGFFPGPAGPAGPV